MTKELFVSSTPHETKVGMVEDDQLAEIYLERENEYTLAGSIYQGRVTRVLPGMQSAFVDIGLERDAFLYVSDFMELGEDQDDIEDVPTNRPAPAQSYQPRLRPEAQGPEPSGGSNAAAAQAEESPAAAQAEIETAERPNIGDSREGQDRGGWRGRRRRRGRGRDRFPESKFTRPASEGQREREAPRAEYGPPAGYQPIILPG